jgi:DNA-binding transcriptional ArsR family regulator
MCDNSINTLLYSSNANKEIYFYLKQKKSLLQANLSPNNSHKKKKVLSALGEIMANRSNLQIIQSLKSKINQFFNHRNEILEQLRNKQDLFLKSQPLIDNKLKKLYYKPINEIRLKGYRKAFKKCLNRTLSDSDFDLPNIKFNMSDVYSRLFNNVILTPNSLRNKLFKKSKENERYETINRIENSKNNLNSHGNDSPITPKNTKNPKKRKSVISFNSEPKKNEFYYRRLPNFNVVNIIKSAKGKEFSIKVTPKIRQKCWSKLSGGPRSKSPPSSNSVKIVFDKNEENNKSQEIDYKIMRNKKIFNIDKSKSKENMNNIILYNTLILDKNSWGSEFVKVINYRDVNFNTNLHIAVKSNSYKFVKYFLDKKISPNEVNKFGQTPLHFAFKKGNKVIIDLLIKNGGDLNIKDNKGKKPIDYGSREVNRFFQHENQK